VRNRGSISLKAPFKEEIITFVTSYPKICIRRLLISDIDFWGTTIAKWDEVRKRPPISHQTSGGSEKTVRKSRYGRLVAIRIMRRCPKEIEETGRRGSFFSTGLIYHCLGQFQRSGRSARS
jgi:hypothetical protein